MVAIRERYGDDKMKQQQALMELYKKEKINPLAGCLPIVVQIPVFFALYKVLFVTIEMRHAPFIGWIKDLSAPDPTNLFNLFGLIPYDPTLIPVLGQFLHLGFWPIVMGLTMLVQMKLNPAPPDPTQKMIFDWMPLIFTFMPAGFSARQIPSNLASLRRHCVTDGCRAAGAHCRHAQHAGDVLLRRHGRQAHERSAQQQPRFRPDQGRHAAAARLRGHRLAHDEIRAGRARRVPAQQRPDELGGGHAPPSLTRAKQG